MRLAGGGLGIMALGGLVAGLLLALPRVQANRYLELGMESAALYTYRGYGLRLAASALILGAALALVGLALALLLRRPLGGSGRAASAAYGITGTLLVAGVLLAAGYRLNKQPWFPATLSPRGFLYNGLFALAVALLFALLLYGVYRYRRASLRLLTRLGAPLAVLAALLPFLALEGLYRLDLARGSRGPNLLLVTVDTLRHDHLGCYGYPRETSPNIDRLAREGIRFEQAVVQWPKTGPSFASMLTSTYSHRNGLVRTGRKPIAEHFVLLAESLKEAGYRTAGIVANVNIAAAYNFDQGFDRYTEVWREDPEQEAVTVSEAALAWMRDAGGKRPFFLWLHYVDPHAYYSPPGDWDGHFVGDGLEGEERLIPMGEHRSDDMGAIPLRAALEERRELAYYVAQYDAEIRYMDTQVGRVLDELERQGLSEGTVVAFTSDHGESLGEHEYYFEHGRLPYDACARVPLLLRLPERKAAGRVVEPAVELIDLYPTLLDALGLPPSPELQGRSLLPLTEGRKEGFPKPAFTESGYEQDYQRALRLGRWKLIYVPSEADRRIMQGAPFELYDLEADPGETVNLFEEEPEIGRELAERLLAWVRASGAEIVEAEETLSIDEESLEALRALGYID